MATTVNLQIPIESLITAIDTLDLVDQQRLLEILSQKIFEAEEDNYEEDPETTAEIEAVQAEYRAGDYVTFDNYLASRIDNAS
ncbi:MAG: hypothetical protein WA883_11185 [Phormidesmis sp.]